MEQEEEELDFNLDPPPNHGDFGPPDIELIAEEAQAMEYFTTWLLNQNPNRNSTHYRTVWREFRSYILTAERWGSEDMDRTHSFAAWLRRTNAIEAVANYLRMEPVYSDDDTNEVVMNVCEAACRWKPHVDQLLDGDLVTNLVRFIERAPNDTLATFRAFNALNNLALMSETHSALIAARAHELCMSNWGNQSKIRALSLLCKLFGKQEEGIGPTIIAQYMPNLHQYADVLSQVIQAYPVMVENRVWDPVEMMNDFLLVATADVHKPSLGFLVSKVTEIIELENRLEHTMLEHLLSKAVSLLLQLLFEDSLLPEFVQCRERLDQRLARFVPPDVESSRELTLLRRQLEDLKDDDDSAMSLEEKVLPDTPTYAFIYCLQPSAVPIAEVIISKLDNNGLDSRLSVGQLDAEIVEGSYAGAILMEPVYFVDFEEYAYHERCMGERDCVMAAVWELVSNYNEKWDLVQCVLQRANNFIIPEDPREDHVVIRQVLYDITERYEYLYPQYPIGGANQAPEVAEPSASVKNMDEKTLLGLVEEMAGKMAELQNEIVRLSTELVQTRASLPELVHHHSSPSEEA